ncbi:hypothetical protein AVEN_214463-1 [Araneus ventricosus]|uniref:Uncharacterized protein n=1 Tax=Araneus ventricosus TaxID=182803 RepID=A0A4Y2CUI6_ARAVE|nr:hypothetical protein AVEN_214463-1 [Araneus ventricosus]
MPPKERTSLGSITKSGKKSRLLRLTESSLQSLQHQIIRQANLWASEEPVQTQHLEYQRKLNSVYGNNALDKKTYRTNKNSTASTATTH